MRRFVNKFKIRIRSRERLKLRKQGLLDNIIVRRYQKCKSDGNKLKNNRKS